MNKITRLKKYLSLMLGMILSLSMITSAFAATVDKATIDTGKTASLTVYKYDMTRAAADGVWDTSSYVSTGIYDASVNNVLGNTSFTNNSGTNNTAYGYAIKGVEFKYLKIADIKTYSRLESSGAYTVSNLYGFKQNDATTAFLNALGLAYSDVYYSADGIYYFTSDALNTAMSTSLAANATTVKDALETMINANGGIAMTETDEYGKSSVTGLPVGLYLVVETRVPDMVTATCNPFLVSLPMTTIDGLEWNYDVTVYPKNATGMPTLEKTVREDKNSTGKNNGTVDSITDGYAHTATASDGDVVDYQILSTLPTITSKASYLTTYTYVDTLSKGITYNKGDVVIEFFTDAACTDKIANWDENSGKFTVTYDSAANTMTIAMSAAGLKEMNESTAVYNASSLFSGYSDCTMRITYAATVNSDATVVYGDAGNPNEVQLTWKRTNTTYYDVLNDDCHVYTYGMDLLKKFSDGAGNFANVKFNVHNDTDNYYLVATKTGDTYFVTGFTSKVSDATVFVPSSNGHLIVKGLENDSYTITETATDAGYTLLKNSIKVVIKANETNTLCGTCGKKLLSATATVNGDDVSMDSVHAIVPLTVMNTKGFELPKTGSHGTWMFTAAGLAVVAVGMLVLAKSKKKAD